MALVYLTEASSGAPTLSNVNGSLCGVLDWALVQNGWAIEYTNGANARVYRPGSGNRFRLHVNHDSAVSGNVQLATIRGCENATDATTLVDPFPTVAQQASNASNVCVANGAGRPFKILVGATFVLAAFGTTNQSSAGWDFFFFGDVPSTIPGDAYNTIIAVGGATSASVTGRIWSSGTMSPYVAASNRVFWARSADGSIKSSYGCFWGSGTAFSSTTSAPAARSGYLNQLVRERVGATCAGSSSTTIGALAVHRRGWVPNLWNPVHSGMGGLTSDDTFTDSAYAAGSQFALIVASAGIGAIMETTDTWSAPSG